MNCMLFRHFTRIYYKAMTITLFRRLREISDAKIFWPANFVDWQAFLRIPLKQPLNLSQKDMTVKLARP